MLVLGLVLILALLGGDSSGVTTFALEWIVFFAILVWVVVMGLALFFERGDHILRIMLPAISGGAFAWLLIGEPTRGISSGPNSFGFAISLLFGIIYICHLAKERPTPVPVRESSIDEPTHPPP